MPNLISAHFGPAGALIAGGYDTATRLQNGKVLFVGGGYPLGRAELYDPTTNEFTSTGSMVEGRRVPFAVLLANGKVLVAGGVSGGCAVMNIDSVELYNPGTGHFTSLGTPMKGQYYQSATLLDDGRVLFAGGQLWNDVDQGTPVSELFDPATNTVATTGALLHTRSGATATLLPDHTVLIAGGGADGPTNTAELYHPATGKFTNVASTMTAVRQNAVATLLANGEVLIAGGNNGTTAVKTAELYDPATGQFTATGSMAAAREGATATVLPDHTVLIAGGGDSAAAAKGAEVYNLGTGAFTSMGPMSTARSSLTATWLSNGLVLLVGNGSADLYQP